MATVDDVRRIVALDNGLATVSVVRPDGTVLSTVVNAGVVDHPVTGLATIAFVGRPATRKITHLRANPQATLLWRAGWAWVAAEGPVELVGPDDSLDGVPGAAIPGLLRAVYTAAGGGEHDDWAEYDRVVAAERRMAVLVVPSRIYVNP
ncbi:MAG: pyridoxamine 5'-phosphate oxidase family protein [Acidimicrobiales bacterium]|nr:pyridoxamine 5'-phosphate oxidase family protein [Acidimicrobiales bacterium]